MAPIEGPWDDEDRGKHVRKLYQWGLFIYSERKEKKRNYCFI